MESLQRHYLLNPDHKEIYALGAKFDENETVDNLYKVFENGESNSQTD